MHYSLTANGLSSLHSVFCGLELLSIFSSAFESTFTLELSILLGKGNGGSTIKPRQKIYTLHKQCKLQN